MSNFRYQFTTRDISIVIIAHICHIIWRGEVNVKGRSAFVYIYTIYVS